VSPPDNRHEIVHVPFHGGTIQAVQDDLGNVLIVVKWICESLGIDFSSQLAKLKNHHWATVGSFTTVDPNGRQREHSVIPLRALPMWLATIDLALGRVEGTPCAVPREFPSPRSTERAWRRVKPS